MRKSHTGHRGLVLIRMFSIDLAEYLTRHHEEGTPNSRHYQLTYC